MTAARPPRGLFLHLLYIGCLVGYVLAGCRLVPLHGDESTILYMSADFDTLFLRGDLAHIEYRDPPPSDDPEAATKQALRIVNGVSSKYVYGLSWWLAGLTRADLPQQWQWGADYAYNQSQKAVPGDVLLFICRWASALMTAVSVAFVFGIGRQVGGWRTAYVAAFFYALTPAILVNGRRANFESALLLFSVALLYLALRWLNQPLRARRIVILGIVAGLTLASKHTGVITVALAFLILLLGPTLARQWASLSRILAATVMASVIALGIFLALNASWWATPLTMPGIVWQQRQMLLNEQTAAFGGFASTTDRVATLIGQSLLAAPQYYEVKQGWPDWIGTQINHYEAAGLAGLDDGRWTFLALTMLLGAGLRGVFHVRYWIGRDPVKAVRVIAVGLWLAVNAITLYALTPLGWQRYYLPLIAPVAISCGLLFIPYLPKQTAATVVA